MKEFAPKIENIKRKRLMASIVNVFEQDELTKNKIKDIEEKGENISLYLSQVQREESDIRGHSEMYSISPCDDKDKFSKSFHNCVGIVATGISRETNKPISILTHQNPGFFLNKEENQEEVEEYIADFQDRLRQIQHSSKDESLDIVIIGGQYADKNEYLKSIDELSKFVLGVTGINPQVVAGPNVQPGIFSTSVYLDTKNQAIYYVRPENSSVSNESFNPNDADNQWQKIEKKHPKFNPGV